MHMSARVLRVATKALCSARLEKKVEWAPPALTLPGMPQLEVSILLEDSKREFLLTKSQFCKGWPEKVKNVGDRPRQRWNTGAECLNSLNIDNLSESVFRRWQLRVHILPSNGSGGGRRIKYIRCQRWSHSTLGTLYSHRDQHGAPWSRLPKANEQLRRSAVAGMIEHRSWISW